MRCILLFCLIHKALCTSLGICVGTKEHIFCSPKNGKKPDRTEFSGPFTQQHRLHQRHPLGCELLSDIVQGCDLRWGKPAGGKNPRTDSAGAAFRWNNLWPSQHQDLLTGTNSDGEDIFITETTWGSFGSGNGQFWYPKGIAFLMYFIYVDVLVSKKLCCSCIRFKHCIVLTIYVNKLWFKHLLNNVV